MINKDVLELDKRNAPNELIEPCRLTIDQFEDVSITRCQRWHKDGLDSWSLSDWFTATAGELGEAANAIKKLNRVLGNMENINDVGRHLTDVKQAASFAQHELADTFIYMVILAHQLEAQGAPSLSQAIRHAFNNKSREYGFPERVGQHSVYLAFDPNKQEN